MTEAATNDTKKATKANGGKCHGDEGREGGHDEPPFRTTRLSKEPCRFGGDDFEGRRSLEKLFAVEKEASDEARTPKIEF